MAVSESSCMLRFVWGALGPILQRGLASSRIDRFYADRNGRSEARPSANAISGPPGRIISVAGLLTAILVGALEPVAAQPVAIEATPPIICGSTWGQYMSQRSMGMMLWSHAGWSERTAPLWTNYINAIGGLDSPAHSPFAGGLLVAGGCAEHALRWLEEALAYGDIIVLRPVVADIVGPNFFVAHAGTPPESVEAVIRADYRRWRRPEEAEAMIHAYRTQTAAELRQTLDAIAAALPTLSYEDWRSGIDQWGNRVYWDHDAPLADRMARTLAYAEPIIARRMAAERDVPNGQDAPFFSLGLSYGSGVFAFVDMPPGTDWTLTDRYRARWVTEAIEGGDIVVPYLTRGNEWEPRRIGFAVFAAGLPSVAIERELRYHLRYWEDYATDEIEVVIATYRTLIGAPEPPQGP